MTRLTATFFLNEMLLLLLLCIFASLPFIPEFSGLILIHVDIVRGVPQLYFTALDRGGGWGGGVVCSSSRSSRIRNNKLIIQKLRHCHCF